MPYSTYRTNSSSWKTIGIWCLLWCFSNGRAMLRAGDQNPNCRGRNGWAEMHQRLLCCKLSSVGTHPRSARSLQTAYGGKPEAHRNLHTFLQSLSTLTKREISERFLWLQDWECIWQTSAVINTHLLCIWRGLHTYLTAFSRRASSALSFESPSFCFTVGKPSLKALTYLVSMRMSAFAGFSTALQINSCVTGIDLFMETHRSER